MQTWRELQKWEIILWRVWFHIKCIHLIHSFNKCDFRQDILYINKRGCFIVLASQPGNPKVLSIHGLTADQIININEVISGKLQTLFKHMLFLKVVPRWLFFCFFLSKVSRFSLLCCFYAEVIISKIIII